MVSIVGKMPSEHEERAEAEAAAWLARLRAPDAGEDAQRAFRAWCAADPFHAAAFERQTALWEAVGGLRDEIERKPLPTRRQVISRRVVLASLAGAVIAGGIWSRAGAAVYSTAVGEQRRIALSDETHVILDTDSEIRVHFGDRERRVELSRGRASFAVSNDPRPFIVEAAASRVTAGNASFDVRRDAAVVTVTMVDGGAAVAAGGGSRQVATGERLVVGAGAPQLSKPDAEDASGWKNGRAIFRQDSLADAAAEMNRYSTLKLTVAGEAAALRVSGSYRTGDSEAFARSVGALFQLRVAKSGAGLVLSQ